MSESSPSRGAAVLLQIAIQCLDTTGSERNGTDGGATDRDCLSVIVRLVQIYQFLQHSAGDEDQIDHRIIPDSIFSIDGIEQFRDLLWSQDIQLRFAGRRQRDILHQIGCPLDAQFFLDGMKVMEEGTKLRELPAKGRGVVFLQ